MDNIGRRRFNCPQRFSCCSKYHKAADAMTITSLPVFAGYSAKDKFLRSIDDDIDLPALGSNVTRFVQLTSADYQTNHDLTKNNQTNDSLTQKIQRLSNSVSYR